MTSFMEIIDYFLDLLRGLLCHWCFEERVVLPVIKLNLALLYFIIFVHYDRCGALVCLFITISVLDLSSLSAICSLKGRLFRGSGLCEHFYVQK